MSILNPPKWEAIEAIGTWLAALATLAAVCVALWPAIRDARSRRIERRGEVAAMSAEVERSSMCIEALLNDGVMAPLYRLPIDNFKRALPKLLGDGSLTPAEVIILVDFENRIEELNRGLERAGEAAAAPVFEKEKVGKEWRRNQSKAKEITEEVQERYGGRALMRAVEDTLNRASSL
jgi:hypothetical protein